MQLTKDDVAAIRGATSYSVHLQDGVARLNLTKRLERKTVQGFAPASTSSELERLIVGDAATLANAWFHEMYPRGAWEALRQLVRVRDVLLFWVAQDGSNDYMKACEIPKGKLDGHYRGYDRVYCDELQVSLERGGKYIVRDLVLTYSICPENTARAYRGQGTQAAQYELVVGGAR
jgi:hypothetical protein